LKLYIDTSVLVKLYYPEPLSRRAEELLKNLKQPLLFTPFHELEITNAFALNVFRNEISKEIFNTILEIFKEDKISGTLKVVNPDWAEVFLEALKISKLYSLQIGARSLDIIHVAAAGMLNCDTFLTNDRRQAFAAEKIGLKSIDLQYELS